MSNINQDSHEMANLLCEFFQVAINSILYFRKLYPESIFIPKKIYGIIVHQSEHPLLNEYIAESLKTVQLLITRNQLKKVFLCITSHGKVIERYVIDVLHLRDNVNSDPILLILEQNLRAFCLKLNASQTYLKPLPANAEFHLRVQTTEYSAVSLNNEVEYSDFPWIQVQHNKQPEKLEIVPVHSINTERLGIDMYLECMV